MLSFPLLREWLGTWERYRQWCSPNRPLGHRTSPSIPLQRQQLFRSIPWRLTATSAEIPYYLLKWRRMWEATLVKNSQSEIITDRIMSLIFIPLIIGLEFKSSREIFNWTKYSFLSTNLNFKPNKNVKVCGWFLSCWLHLKTKFTDILNTVFKDQYLLLIYNEDLASFYTLICAKSLFEVPITGVTNIKRVMRIFCRSSICRMQTGLWRVRN